MDFEVAPLPYAKDALEPVMSRETFEFHYEKHHKAYMTKLKSLIEGKPEANKTLVEVIRASSGGIMCLLSHSSCFGPAATAGKADSNARGDSTTATSRPCFTMSTRPNAATSSRRPPKLFLASLADTLLDIWLF